MRSYLLLFKILCGCIFISSIHANSSHREKSWGYHLMLDCKACEIEKITDRDHLAKFVKVLIAAIDMKSYGETILEHFAEHDPEAAGYSLLQLIETSSITGHFVDKNGDAYIDIFSCKPFDPEIAVKTVQEWLHPEKIKKNFITRQA